MRKEFPSSVSGLIVGITGLCLFALESKRRLRLLQRESKAVRTARNLAIAAMSAAVITVIETPLAKAVARKVEEDDLGVVPRLTTSPAGRLILGVLLLDYGLYVWHVLTHKAPTLWRFPMVHHVDLDLDASTALRFHFGEMLLSVPWRVAQIRVTGASPLAVSVWQTFLFASILYHHSNVVSRP